MTTKSYLIFSLHNSRYAIPATEVTEIFLLPELIPIAEAPHDIVGLLNLHGAYIPVMHLDLRFGRPFEYCNTTDSVVVVESLGFQVGIIVHQVETVIDIDDLYIQGDLTYGREQNIDRVFVRGAINLDDELILLLNVDNLVRHPARLQSLVDEEKAELSSTIPSQNFYDLYLPTASTKTRETLAQRAHSLKTASSDRSFVESISIAVVSINESYFGLNLGIVREFVNIKRFTTIPCCPSHVIGNMNLRGEILTLIDIRQPLNLSVQSDKVFPKAVVVEVGDIVVGIAVEEVFDIIELPTEELKPIPAATDAQTASYLQGMTDYQAHPLNLIDLSKLLSQGAMTVELAA